MYKAIKNYGIIGNMHSTALVANDGSIDFCCMPHMDSPTLFAALLDDEKGGFFKIAPVKSSDVGQEYIENTNVLKCVFKNNTGKAELVDFMPVKLNAEYGVVHMIRRFLHVTAGEMEFEIIFAPRPQYATVKPDLELGKNRITVTAKNETFTLLIESRDDLKYSVRESTVFMRTKLRQYDQLSFSLIYGKPGFESGDISVEATISFWRKWLAESSAADEQLWKEHKAMLSRSLLVLKLLTFEPTGAIAASATTSLPEAIGAERNWDYRYTWLRDASFTLQAFYGLGHFSESVKFEEWLFETFKKHGSISLQTIYSISGNTELPERELAMKGYCDSRPVRVGNAAHVQKQSDIYGEVLDTVWTISKEKNEIKPEFWDFYKKICDYAWESWQTPDRSIWEFRTEPRHYVYSKLMSWVAMDRVIKIAEKHSLDGPVNDWSEMRETIKKDIINKGYNKALGSFVQSYESDYADASLLQLALKGFLPIEDERIAGTIRFCKNKLMRNGFMLRYNSPDGLNGNEGSFILCNFWLIRCLAMQKQYDEASDLLDRTKKAANHLGLFSEEIDYSKGDMLGNFPQALGHIGFINSVISLFEAKPIPTHSAV